MADRFHLVLNLRDAVQQELSRLVDSAKTMKQKSGTLATGHHSHSDLVDRAALFLKVLR